MKHFLLFSFLMASIAGWSQTTLYGVDPQTGNLYAIDTTTFTETTTTLTSNTGVVDGCLGLATDPCGPTYVLYKNNGNRYIGTINFTTGVITEIGVLADNVASIAYDFTTSTLYGVSGDGAYIPETLYEINTTTAAMTFAVALGNGDDGEAIAYNPTDGLLYHWSGWGLGDVIMETINLSTLTVNTPGITFSGDDIFNVGSAVYAGGEFIVSDINDGSLHIVTTAGAVTNTSSFLDVKGLAFEQSPTLVSISGASGTSICSGQSTVLTATSNGVGASFEWFDGNGVSTGITTPTFTASAAGTYICQVTDVCLNNDSDTIILTAGVSPNVQLTPAGSVSICPGDTVNISGVTTAVFNQWYLNGSMISGATNLNYDAVNEGVYNLIQTSIDGCSDSASTGVTVAFSSVPNVVLSPAGTASFCPGADVELTVNTGGGAIQWYQNGALITGATTNSYLASAAGSYNVIKTNMSGCTDSSATPIAVSEAPLPSVILTPSPDVEFCGENTVDISVNSGGGSRQWYMNGGMIPGETGTTYTVSEQGVYNVLKTNTSGCSDSAAVGTTAIDTCLLSFGDASQDLTFNMYPNPATTQLTIDLSVDVKSIINSLEIIGMDGKIALSFNKEALLSDNFTINLNEISAGLYIVKLATTDYAILKELVIE